MGDSSEATRRVFERMLEKLKGQLDPAALDAIRRLVEEGKLADLDAVEEAIRPKGNAHADR